MRPLSTLLRTILPLLFPALLPAQLVGGGWEVVQEHHGGPYAELGYAIAAAGDVDGDGVDDFAASAPWGGGNVAGEVRVYSGATGALIWSWSGLLSLEYFGQSIAAGGDADGDGVPDVLVGRGSTPVVDLYSGATGQLIRVHSLGSEFGRALAFLDDLDGDGAAELAIGDPDGWVGAGGNAGTAFVYSGATGALLWQFDGAADGDELGSSLARVGDVDGDGAPELLIGAPYASPNGLLEAGSVYLVSGATGSLIRRYDGDWPQSLFGHAVAGAGDLDGDGRAEQMVGALTALGPGGRISAGAAFVYDGATGSQRYRFDGKWNNAHLGHAVSGVGDLDGDGVPELLVGSPEANPEGRYWAGVAYLHSGADGSLLRSFRGPTDLERLGWAVAGLGDLDGDGLPELALGAPLRESGQVHDAGAVVVHSFRPYLYADSTELSATPGIPVSLRLDFPATEAGASYLLLASAAGTGPSLQGGVEVPLTEDPLLLRLASGWSPANLVNGRGQLDPNGDAQATLFGHGALLPHLGRSVHLAALSYDSAGLSGRLSSAARSFTIVP